MAEHLVFHAESEKMETRALAAFREEYPQYELGEDEKNAAYVIEFHNPEEYSFEVTEGERHFSFLNPFAEKTFKTFIEKHTWLEVAQTQNRDVIAYVSRQTDLKLKQMAAKK